MAYTRKSFLFDKPNADAKSASVRDDEKMNVWLDLEVQGMRMALAGDEQISTG
jgi:hypothetical protein